MTILMDKMTLLMDKMTLLPGGRPPPPRRDGTEVPVGKVAVPKTGQKPPSPRRDASGAPMGLLSVPKTGQKNTLPRENATEVLVGRGGRAEDRPKTSRRADS